MPKKTSTQREAERLAKFLSLESSEVQTFRHDNPRFAPAKWWDYHPLTLPWESPAESKTMNWQVTQDFLRTAWDDGFELDLSQLVQLLLCVFDPDARKSVAVATPADTIFGLKPDQRHPLFASLSELDQDWGFHIGVRYLAEHRWAAKVCEYEECKRPFVADIPVRKYCFELGADGLHCSERVIKHDHLKWWHTKGDKKRRENREPKRKAAKKKTAR